MSLYAEDDDHLRWFADEIDDEEDDPECASCGAPALVEKHEWSEAYLCAHCAGEFLEWRTGQIP